VEVAAVKSSVWASTLIALAFLALVAFLVRLGVDHQDSEQLWGIIGLIVGVAVGAIPSFFFRGQADAAQKKAQEVEKSARSIVAEVPADRAEILKRNHPEFFAMDSRG
jgi:hypothetical protein